MAGFPLNFSSVVVADRCRESGGRYGGSRSNEESSVDSGKGAVELYIECPETERLLGTGIVVGRNTLADLPEVPIRTACPFCGGEHIWWPSEAIAQPSGKVREWLKSPFPSPKTEIRARKEIRKKFQ